MNRCNESPLRGENADFQPAGKFNTASLPLRGNLPVMMAASRKQAKYAGLSGSYVFQPTALETVDLINELAVEF